MKKINEIINKYKEQFMDFSSYLYLNKDLTNENELKEAVVDYVVNSGYFSSKQQEKILDELEVLD